MGTFFTKNNRPFFSPKEDVEFEIKTEERSGAAIIVDSDPQELIPNKFYIFGTVSKALKILKLLSHTNEYVEEYAGEFTIAEGGSVKFPGIIRWVGGTPDFSKAGHTYQFRILNGIGQYLDVE